VGGRKAGPAARNLPGSATFRKCNLLLSRYDCRVIPEAEIRAPLGAGRRSDEFNDARCKWGLLLRLVDCSR